MNKIKNLKDYPPTLKVEEMAELLRIGRNQAYDLCRKSEFYPAFRVGEKSIRISKKQLIRWIEENDVELEKTDKKTDLSFINQ